MDEAELTALLEQHATMHSVPGAAIGILHRGEATTACYGVADVRTGEPVTDRTTFSLGSLTKPMVATVIAGLELDDLLAMDDAVAVHVPELNVNPWAQARTLRDLLANRSGLPLSAGLEFGFAGRRREDEQALKRFVAELPGGPSANFWSYSNVGWCVLGRVIETATGITWEDAMYQHLMDMGLTETSFVIGPSPPDRAIGHEIRAEGAVPVPPLSARAYGPAGTTAVSTVTDLLCFARLHLEDRSLAALRETHSDVSIHGWLDAWCLGWAGFDWDGPGVWGWDGLISGERSVLRMMPDNGTAIGLMTNSSTGRAMYRSLFSELVPASFGVGFPSLRLDPSSGAAGDLSRYAGVYAWPDRRVEITVSGDTLLLRTGDTRIEAFPIDERAFLVDAGDPDNPTVTFGAFDRDGRPGVLYQMLWGLPRIDG